MWRPRGDSKVCLQTVAEHSLHRHESSAVRDFDCVMSDQDEKAANSDAKRDLKLLRAAQRSTHFRTIAWSSPGLDSSVYVLWICVDVCVIDAASVCDRSLLATLASDGVVRIHGGVKRSDLETEW